jgi:hypothetical protein
MGMRGILLLSWVLACSQGGREVTGTTGTNGGGHDLAGVDLSGPLSGDVCVNDPKSCYTVYAHGDHFLYKIDLMAKNLVPVGPFNAPMVNGNEDVITDLAVSPADVIYVTSKTQLYTASASDGHVTLVGAVAACGTEAVAMTFGPDGTLYSGDFNGQFCTIDITTNPPTVKPVAKLSGGLALSGDIVSVGNGTMYGTAYRLSDTSGGTRNNNLLITINPMTAATTVIGSTGYKNLFGVSFALGQVFGFTHDQSGDVVTIDPTTGKGTLYGTFKDPSTGMGISFASAGVNSMVEPIPG